jgi:hypothetical protein
MCTITCIMAHDELKFNDVSAANDMQKASISAGSVAVDLDNDGDLELVTNNMDEPAYIYQNMTMEKSISDKKPAFVKVSVKYTKANPDGIGAKLYSCALQNKLIIRRYKPVQLTKVHRVII